MAYCLFVTKPLSIGPSRTKFSRIWSKMQIFSFKQMHLKMLAICSCPSGLNYFGINIVFLSWWGSLRVSGPYYFWLQKHTCLWGCKWLEIKQMICCLTFTRLKRDFIYCVHTVHTIVSINFLFLKKVNIEKFWMCVLQNLSNLNSIFWQLFLFLFALSLGSKDKCKIAMWKYESHIWGLHTIRYASLLLNISNGYHNVRTVYYLSWITLTLFLEWLLSSFHTLKYITLFGGILLENATVIYPSSSLLGNSCSVYSWWFCVCG